MATPAPRWIPNQHLTTSRLAWLAARPVLLKRSRPWWTTLLRILGSSGRGRSGVGSAMARDLSSEVVDDRLATYSVPVDRVSERLSPTEVATLREHGTLPDWFLDAVEEERKKFLRSLR
ncbi:MAG TPA: hypothetical protein VFB40_12540 [Actinocrinis sp.]|nr:hypothetical protein [Actinocrinis sp.]